jgi:transcriptional regulator with XRE-family HTH domain
MALRIRESSIEVLMKRAQIRTQTELASLCDMRVQSLNKVLKGRQSPGSATIDKLCEVLGAQPGDFLFHESDSAEAD